MIRVLILFISYLFFACNSGPLEKALKSDPLLKSIYNKSDLYNTQIIYSEIINNDGQINFKEFEYNLDETTYFYPASSIKLPIVVLTLEKINELRFSGYDITIDSELNFKQLSKTGEIVYNKTNFKDIIAEVFLISSNSAANILIDFVGYDSFNKKIRERGLNQSTLNHKFNPDPFVHNQWMITDNQGNIISADNSNHKLILNSNLKRLKQGTQTIVNGVKIQKPFDFTNKNRSSLKDMDGIVKRLIYPSAFKEEFQFKINTEEYDFIRYWMSRFTFEDTGIEYQGKEYFYNAYNKFLFHGDTRDDLNKDIRVYNKVGEAYGQVTDIGYIKNYRNNTEFFISATIYVNDNNVINDGSYETDSIGIPFFSKLARELYNNLLD